MEIFDDEYSRERVQVRDVRGFVFHLTPRFTYHYGRSTGYEQATVSIYEQLLSPGQTAIDVGAHYGYYSLVAARSVGPTGQVVAIEPVPFNRELLRRNIVANGFAARVVDLGMAVSSECGRRGFRISRASDNSGFDEHPNSKTLEEIDVETITLDELTRRFCRGPALYKIDAEGHENEILSGAEMALSNPLSIFLMEFNPKCFQAAGHPPEEILTRLLEMPFLLYFVEDDKGRVTRLTRASDWPFLMSPSEYRNFFLLTKAQDSRFRAVCAALGLRIRSIGLSNRVRSAFRDR